MKSNPTSACLFWFRSRALKAVLLLGIAVPFWTACKPPNFKDLLQVKDVDQDALKAASQDLCTEGEKLAARPVSSDEKIANFPREIVAFGFFKGTTGCALTGDFNQGGIADEWFSILLQDNCLANGSVWTLRSIKFPDHSVEMELSQFHRTPEYVVKIKAGEWVTMKNLADAAGFITYRCEPKLAQ